MNTNPRRTQPSVAPPAPAPDRGSPDRDAPTPRVSGSFSAFRDSALEVLDQIRPHPRSQLVEGFRDRAETLIAEFGSWPAKAPDTLARSAAIQRLIELREQVRSYLDGER